MRNTCTGSIHRYGSDKIQRKLFEIRWNESTFRFVGFSLRVSMHKVSIDAGAANGKRGGMEEIVRERTQSQYLSVFWVNVVIQTEWITNLDISRSRDRNLLFGSDSEAGVSHAVVKQSAQRMQAMPKVSWIESQSLPRKFYKLFEKKIHCKIFGLALICPPMDRSTFRVGRCCFHLLFLNFAGFCLSIWSKTYKFHP